MAGAGLIANYVDYQQNELRQPRMHQLASAPGTPVTGQMYYDTATNIMYYRNATTWVPMDGSSGVTFGNVTAQTSFGAASNNGAAGTASRSDHVHGTPAHTTALHQEMLSLHDLTDVVITASASGDVLVHNGTNYVDINFDARVQTSRLDQMAAPTASVSLNSQKIVSLLDPTGAQDAATKAYVDAARAGIDWKESVKGLSTTNITIATPGTTIGGVTATSGERYVLAGQSTASQNGIYIFNGSAAAMTRTTDADASGELSPGTMVYVESGTFSGQAWVVSATGATPWVPGSSSSTWTQAFGANATTAGAGLVANSNVFDVVGTASRITVNADSIDIASDYVGQTSITTLGTITTGTWNGTTVALNRGGTGATTAPAARTALAAAGFYNELLSTSATSYVITHNLGTRDVIVSVRQANTPWAAVGCIDEATTTNTVTLRFGTAPTSNDLRVTILGAV